jgi:hypothetical protein
VRLHAFRRARTREEYGMGTLQASLHGGLELVAHARSGKAMSDTRTCAQQPPAADALQPPLRSGFRAQLRRSVRLQALCVFLPKVVEET